MKNYYLQFGSGDPRTYAGLSPTFLIFRLADNTSVTPPGITCVGPSTGIYTFSWGTTTSIAFLADAATTSPGSTGRYVTGSLDPVDRMDEVGTSLVAIGTTNAGVGLTALGYGVSIYAQGTTIAAISTTLLATSAANVSLVPLVGLIGSTASSFGTTATDPADFFGYMKRFQELLEGANAYNKASGVLSLYSRGSSVMLRQLTITNSVSTVIKS
jgi:hypothetical protein